MGLVVVAVQKVECSNLMEDVQKKEEEEVVVVEADVERCSSLMVLEVGRGIEMDGMVELH